MALDNQFDTEPGTPSSGILTNTPVEAPSTVADSGVRDSLASPASNSDGVRNFDAEVTPPPGVQSGPPAPPITPADPNQAAGYTSIRDAAKQFGYQWDQEYADDEAALNHLIQRANAGRQEDYYAQIGRRLAPHAQGIRGYLTSQQAPAAAPPARQPWEAPEFDERWLSGVEQDPKTGLILAKPGFPQEIAAKVQEYATWKAEYDRDPAKILNQMVEAKAAALFDEKFAERAAQQETRSAVSSIVQENLPWFAAQDASGRPIYQANGYPVPSQVGAAYLRHLGSVRQMGITDPRHQDRVAKQLLQGELAQSQLYKQQQAATAAGLPAQQAQAAPNINPLTVGLTPQQREFTPGASPPSTAGLSLNEQLARAFAEGGVTDADFRNLSG